MNVKKLMISAVICMSPLIVNAEINNTDNTPRIPNLNDLTNAIGKPSGVYFNIPENTAAGENIASWKDAEKLKQTTNDTTYYHIPVNSYSIMTINDKDIEILTYMHNNKMYKAEMKIKGYKTEEEYKDLEKKLIFKIMENGFVDFTYDEKSKYKLLDSQVKEYTDGISFIKDNSIVTLKANNTASKKYGWEQAITEFNIIIIDTNILNIRQEMEQEYKEYRKNSIDNLVNRIL
jgi:hypothetical protein